MFSKLVKVKSFLFRLDKLKVNKTANILKIFFYLSLKLVNLYRWIKSYVIYKNCSNLDEFFSKLGIYWYGGNEGHTQQVDDETLYLNQISQNAKKILEIGFNGGHSAETFLKSSENVIVHSVDIGFHHYVKFGYFYLKKKYKDRIKIYYGDSTQVLPKLIRDKEQFDFVFIDGGHDYDIVKTDLFNSIILSEKDGIIIVDDVFFPIDKLGERYIDLHNSGPTRAWREVLSKNEIMEIDYKEFSSPSTNKRSLVVGKVKKS